MKCPNCNNEFSNVNARFCPYCGYVLPSTQATSFTYDSNSNAANNNWQSNNYNMYSAPKNNGTNGELLVKIGGSVLAVIYLFICRIDYFL